MDFVTNLIAQHPLWYALLSPPLAILVNDFRRLLAESEGWKDAWDKWKPGIATWRAFGALVNAVVNIPIIAGLAAGAGAIAFMWWR